MTRARATLVSVEDTPYYHCVGRCVRRAFLCGFDAQSQTSFEHRRVWMQERLALLTDTFAIDVCAYALMSNHYHLVLRLSPERSKAWSDRAVIERWTAVYAGSDAARRYLNGEPLDEAEKAALNRHISLWRARLGDMSWFMRSLNEHIARKANAEDQCTGHFWESRFKSQALLDEAALITAMAYVDLNPIRAKQATSIDTSDFTSGQARYAELTSPDSVSSPLIKPRLVAFIEADHRQALEPLPFHLNDYLDLIDTTGRLVVNGKRGFIPGQQPRLLDTLNVAPQHWFDTAIQLHARYELALGTPAQLTQLAKRWGNRWLQGIRHARRLYPVPSG
jgi:REP element-mobilizing transposase RayT